MKPPPIPGPEYTGPRLPNGQPRRDTPPVARSTAVCAACLGSIHCGGEPDFPWHPCAEGEDCGTADHVALTGEERIDLVGT